MAKRRTKSQKQNARHQTVFSLSDLPASNATNSASKKTQPSKSLIEKTRQADDASLLDYQAIKRDLTKTILLSIVIIAAQLYLYTIWR